MGAELDGVRRRVRELTDIGEDVFAERQVAMLRAHQLGAPIADIARWALASEESVGAAVTSLAAEDEQPEYDDRLTWTVRDRYVPSTW